MRHLFGAVWQSVLYGYEDKDGVSPTERGYDLAASLHKSRLIYNKKHCHFDLIDENGRLANAAILLFGKKPQKYFITSEVKCVQFYGDVVEKTMPAYQIYRGDVFELVDQATSFVISVLIIG